MADELLQRVLAQPDRDQPRLDYANAIAAEDPARAELIRSQCELERHGLPEERRARLEFQVEQLLATNLRQWEAAIPANVEEYSWRRGFPYSVLIDFETLPQELPRLAAHVPIDNLMAMDADRLPNLKAIASLPDLRRIKRLDVSEVTLERDGVEELLGSPHLANLKELYLGAHDAGPDIVTALVRVAPTGLTQLSFQGLAHYGEGDRTAAVLAESEFARQLRHLDLSALEVGPEGTRALARSSRLTKLDALHLESNDFRSKRVWPAGAAAIARSDNLASLKVLGLGSTKIGDDGLEALAKSKTLRELQVLSLYDCEISHDGFVHFAVSDVCETIERLTLTKNQLPARSVESMILAAPPRIWALVLAENPIEDAGARMLANSRWSRQLTKLDLGFTGLTDEGATALAESPNLAGLERLYVGGNEISPKVQRQLRGRFGAAVLGLEHA